MLFETRFLTFKVEAFLGDGQSASYELWYWYRNSRPVTSKFNDYLALKGKENVFYKHLSIEDKNTFDKYKKALYGRTFRGKMSNPKEEVTDIEMKTNPDTELFDTKKYKDLTKEKYNLNSAGIDFAYKKQSYVVWIGFKTGTFWIRSGDVSEDLIQYVQGKLLTVIGA
jgi:hypothetical protein